MTNTTTSNSQRIFEVHGTVNIGYKAQADKKAPRELDVRTAPATVTEDELRAAGMSEADIEGLIAIGTLADPDAPTRPSLAPIYAAHALATRIAKHAGRLKVKGSEYAFDGRTYQGLHAFRENVSVERLEAAINDALGNAA